MVPLTCSNPLKPKRESGSYREYDSVMVIMPTPSRSSFEHRRA
jgi:hypothetical protein